MLQFSMLTVTCVQVPTLKIAFNSIENIIFIVNGVCFGGTQVLHIVHMIDITCNFSLKPGLPCHIPAPVFQLWHSSV